MNAVSTVYARAALVLLLILLTMGCSGSSDTLAWPELEGYWEGDFMPGHGFTLILDFTRNATGRQQARVLLFEGRAQIQDDPLKRVALRDGRLSFFIEAKDTPFEGKVAVDSLLIRGRFVFPDGSVHPVLVRKVDRPSQGHFPDVSAARLDEGDLVSYRYAVAALQEDFLFLRDHLERLHPQLYLYTPRDTFDRLFDEAFRSIRQEMTQADYFRLLAPVVAAARCAHTGIRFSDRFGKALEQQETFLPLDVQVVGGKAYLMENYSQDETIPPGSEVVSVNKTPASKILERMRAGLPSDGFNETYKTYQINEDFSSAYASFIERPKRFDLELLTPAGHTVRVALPGVRHEVLRAARAKAHPVDKPAGAFPFTYSLIEEVNAARLRIGAFWAPDEAAFSGFLADAFAQMRREEIEHLILDVRGNRGGPPFFAAELLSYLAAAPYVYFAAPEAQDEEASLYRRQQPKKDHFTGKVYVLVDGGGVSSTGHFLSLVQFYKIGVLIGEEPGGSFYCNDNSLRLTLPHTGLQVNVPRTTYETAVAGYAKGDAIRPDYLVEPTLEDALDGIDTVMAFTLEMIRNRL